MCDCDIMVINEMLPAFGKLLLSSYTNINMNFLNSLSSQNLTHLKQKHLHK